MSEFPIYTKRTGNEWERIKILRKRIKLKKYFISDYLNNFHFHFRSFIIIQIPGTSPILAEKKISKNLPTTAVKIFNF